MNDTGKEYTWEADPSGHQPLNEDELADGEQADEIKEVILEIDDLNEYEIISLPEIDALVAAGAQTEDGQATNDQATDAQTEDAQAEDAFELARKVDAFVAGPTVEQKQLASVITYLDGEIERLVAREVLPASEVTDLLLDLRIQLAGISESA